MQTHLAYIYDVKEYKKKVNMYEDIYSQLKDGTIEGIGYRVYISNVAITFDFTL